MLSSAMEHNVIQQHNQQSMKSWLLTFTDGCARRTLLELQADLLEGNETACQSTLPLKHCGISSLVKITKDFI